MKKKMEEAKGAKSRPAAFLGVVAAESAEALPSALTVDLPIETGVVSEALVRPELIRAELVTEEP